MGGGGKDERSKGKMGGRRIRSDHCPFVFAASKWCVTPPSFI